VIVAVRTHRRSGDRDGSRKARYASGGDRRAGSGQRRSDEEGDDDGEAGQYRAGTEGAGGADQASYSLERAGASCSQGDARRLASRHGDHGGRHGKSTVPAGGDVVGYQLHQPSDLTVRLDEERHSGKCPIQGGGGGDHEVVTAGKVRLLMGEDGPQLGLVQSSQRR
jgi:hypothetical protein